MKLPAARDVNFDIDKYLNRFVPRSRLYLLPQPISWFLGYRDKPRKEIGNVLVWGWSFVGAFCGVALIEGVVKSSPEIQSYAPPLILGSFVSYSLPFRLELVSKHRGSKMALL